MPSIGAGWVWGNDIPYLTSGLGIRTTGSFRFTVDLLWEYYRMPYRLSAEEWEDLLFVRVVDVRKGHNWENGWALQAGIARYIH